MTIKAIIFDLDDTLYPEYRYKESGFKYISGIVSNNDIVYQLINEYDNKGSQPLTDFVNYLVKEYRGHIPQISCYEDTIPVLKKLKDKYKLGLLTNNATGAQPNKLKALNISYLFDAIVIADPPFLKPAPEPFIKILKRLNVNSSESIYVGDDVERDFVTANELGFYTIEIIRPRRLKPRPHKGEDYMAKQVVNSLYDLENILYNI